MSDQSRRNNLIFTKIDEEENESWEKSEKKVIDVIGEHLNLDVNIERAHRLGKKNGKTGPRNIVAKFSSWKDRDMVFRNRRNPELERAGVRIREDFCPGTIQAREMQVPKLRKAREEGKHAFFSYRKLVIRPGHAQFQTAAHKRTEVESISKSNQQNGRPLPFNDAKQFPKLKTTFVNSNLKKKSQISSAPTAGTNGTAPRGIHADTSNNASNETTKVTPSATTPKAATPKAITPKAATPKAATPMGATPKVTIPRGSASPWKAASSTKLGSTPKRSPVGVSPSPEVLSLDGTPPKTSKINALSVTPLRGDITPPHAIMRNHEGSGMVASPFPSVDYHGAWSRLSLSSPGTTAAPSDDKSQPSGVPTSQPNTAAVTSELQQPSSVVTRSTTQALRKPQTYKFK